MRLVWPEVLALILSAVLLLSGRATARDDVPLHVGALFPMDASSGGWAGGKACMPAAYMGISAVNNGTLLPGYKLVIDGRDSKCSPGLALKQLHDLLRDKKKIMLLVGCSTVTTVIAEVAPMWNLVVISYGGSSPALSNRERFQTLFRTHPSATMQNPTRIALFERFKWRQITMLHSVEEVFTTTAKDLETRCQQKGITVKRQDFASDPTDAIRTMARWDSRIIVGMFYEKDARRVLCQAYRQRLFGKKYVWILIGWYPNRWFELEPTPECTAEQMREAAEYHLTTESMMLAMSHLGRAFRDELVSILEATKTTNNSDITSTGGFPEAPLAYDAVFATAHALNCTSKALRHTGKHLEDFTYGDRPMRDVMQKCVGDLHFNGASGEVKFSQLGERIAKTQIEQLQNGSYVVVGYYDNFNGVFEQTNPFKWAGNVPPKDAKTTQIIYYVVSDALYLVIFLLVFIGLSSSVACFLFNMKFAYRGVIIQSQPECNNIMLAGCALCSISLLLLGLPTTSLTIHYDLFPILCHSRVSVLMIGFTFAYGSMFAKVWIVHRIGASENHQIASRAKDEEDGTPWEGIRTLIASMVGRPAYGSTGNVRKSSTPSYGSLLARRHTRLSQPIAATRFYVVILVLFTVDVVIMTVWFFFDPMKRQESAVGLKKEVEDDLEHHPMAISCECNHPNVWIGVVLGYKALLLILGIFVSYETRDLKLRYVNDSRLVGLAIYNVAILSLVTGPIVALLIRREATASFLFISATVILCTYISMGLVFLPKVRFVLRVPPSRDEIQPSNNNVNTLSKAEHKKYEQLCRENDALQKQINEKEERISLCRAKVESILRESSTGSYKDSSDLIKGSSLAAEPIIDSSFSTPTTLTTTALIELQPSSYEQPPGGRYNYEEIENSSSSDEILL